MLSDQMSSVHGLQTNENEVLLHQDQRKEILIVDDEIDFRLSVAELLVGQGYRVSTAWNGEAALEHLVQTKHLPDLITIDLKMPVKDGKQFQNELKRMNLLSRIPVILISGFVLDKNDIPKGVKAVLTKPLDKLEFLEVIEKAIRR